MYILDYRKKQAKTLRISENVIFTKYDVIGALQWKLPRAPLPFNPALYVTVGAQNRSFQKQWLNEFTWLAYSNISMELFANGTLCLLLRLSVVVQNLPANKFRDHTTIRKRQRNITIITKTVTIINYVQPCSITLCRQMPTNPEMYEML